MKLKEKKEKIKYQNLRSSAKKIQDKYAKNMFQKNYLNYTHSW